MENTLAAGAPVAPASSSPPVECRWPDTCTRTTAAERAVCEFCNEAPAAATPAPPPPVVRVDDVARLSFQLGGVKVTLDPEAIVNVTAGFKVGSWTNTTLKVRDLSRAIRLADEQALTCVRSDGMAVVGAPGRETYRCPAHDKFAAELWRDSAAWLITRRLAVDFIDGDERVELRA